LNVPARPEKKGKDEIVDCLLMSAVARNINESIEKIDHAEPELVNMIEVIMQKTKLSGRCQCL